MTDFLVTYRLDHPVDGAVLAETVPAEIRRRRHEIDVTETGLDTLKALTGTIRVDEDNQLRIGDRVFLPDAAINSHLEELTWAAMSAAGIDPDRVDTDLYADQYDWRTRGHRCTAQDGDARITWGPTTDYQSGGTRGWTVTRYEMAPFGHADPDWDERSTEAADTAAEALARVAELVKEVTR